MSGKNKLSNKERFQHDEHEEFDKFFFKHLNGNGIFLGGSCNERSVLRNSKDIMFMKWKQIFQEDAPPLEQWIEENVQKLSGELKVSIAEYIPNEEDVDGLHRIMMTLIRQYLEEEM